MQATKQKLEIELEEIDRRFWSHALSDTLAGALGAGGHGPATYGPGVYRFTAHVTAEDGYTLHGRPFAMTRQYAETEDRPAGTASRALARLCELDEQLQESGWEKLAEPGLHWWSLRYTRD